ncbi:monovalent cation/H(+) antiporter subunit G [Corynebacterium sp. TAE3-ERU12]|uniref:monovalent cation/H(+) antiporter subunit G n=1 Tax=Corynebacterium sp. TAE3-ERU12 TaxID=2849491 RepID=UPI001C43AC28|nr:monovalent cation/H(+) antiporter subunit G [Corynebacterium sp. TAE3-ERU12]MBV7294462.1 monovalent cation/H(+) antiporter subunit G [Corynebacterium sp. TAE3-ERU12]
MVGTILVTTLFAFGVLAGSLYLLGAVISMWRAHDALSRLNQLSAGITVGIPLLVLANVLLDWDAGRLTIGRVLTAGIAIIAMLVVSAVASQVLGRAILGIRDGSGEDSAPH